MNSNHPRAVFFDAVATTIVPRPAFHEVYTDVARQYGLPMDTEELLARFRSAFQKEELADKMAEWRTNEEREYNRWAAIVQHVFAEYSNTDQIFKHLWNHFAQPGSWNTIPRSIETMTRVLQNGIPIGIASNFDSRLRTALNGLLELSNIQWIAISSELGWRKPSPRFYTALCEMTGYTPSEILMIGDDMQNDIEGAQAAGLRAINVTEIDQLDFG